MRPWVRSIKNRLSGLSVYYRNKEEYYLRDVRLRGNRVPTLEEEKKQTDNYLDVSSLNDTDCTTYSREQKASAATYYALTGNLTTAADQAGVPSERVRRWKRDAPWFQEIVDQVHKQKSDEFNAKATLIIEDCIEAIVERIQKGEETVVSNGKVVTKNISARDLAYILSVAFDKKQLNTGKATSIRQNSTDDMLKKLKSEFLKIAKVEEAKTIEGERIE